MQLITATIKAFNGTPTWVFEGLIELTVTLLVSALVSVTNVKPDIQKPLFPAISLYPEKVSPYSVFGRSGELGVIVALRRLAATVTVAGTAGPPFS